MTEHTLTPWRLHPKVLAIVADRDEPAHDPSLGTWRMRIVIASSDYPEADAEYIVRCVNSHADLLAALNAILADATVLRRRYPGNPYVEAVWSNVDAVLAKHEVKS